MTKKLIALVSILIGTTLVPVQAAPTQTIAVVDVGANTSLFSNIVTEVCIVESLTCPNGKKFMEGAGAATIGVSTIAAVNHGTNMISVINKVNPGVGIIPIKIAALNAQGTLGIYTNDAVKQALDWVVANRVKYNIAAVSVSQGKIFSGCYVPAGTVEDVKALKANNVPVIAAAGNDSNKDSMMSIACLPDVISVGATDNPDPGITKQAYCKTCTPTIAKYSNGNPTLYLNGRWYVTQTDGSTKFLVGTSTATASFAAWWVLNFKGNFADTYASILGSTTATSSAERTGKYVALP